MCRLPVFWLPLALVTLFVSRCAIGVSTKLQLGQLISTIIYEDTLFKDVLSEVVKLNSEDLESIPFIKAKVKDMDKVHTLKTLYALSSNYSHYSGDDLNLRVIIFGTSMTCLTYKRLALHLALIIRLIEQDTEKQYIRIRTLIFGHIVPLYMHMLSSVYRNVGDLYSMYKIVYDIMSLLEEGTVFDFQPSINNLKEELNKLNTVIQSSCAVNKMQEYCENLKLDKLKNCSMFITDDQLMSDELDKKTSLESLIENENALLNLYKEMDLFRNVDENVWEKLLNIPQLPTENTNEFKITELPPYRDEVEDIIYMRDISKKYDYIPKNENNAETSESPAAPVKDESTFEPLAPSQAPMPPLE